MRVQKTFLAALRVAILQLSESAGLDISEGEAMEMAMKATICGYLDLRDLIEDFEQPAPPAFRSIEDAERIIQ